MSKRIDLTGQRFGKLTVLEPAENIGGRTTWRCRCDCGKETVVPTGRLRSGETKSCGCQRDRIDLTGQRFGKLTVLEPAEDIGGRPAWRCRCDCGNEVVVRGQCLRRGSTKSCSCARAEVGRKVMPLVTRNIKGQRFGRLVAVEPLDSRIWSSIAWRCRCDCGNEIVSASADLISGTVQSCGCLQKELAASQVLQNAGLVEGTAVNRIRSKRLAKNNTSGVTGVYWCQQSSRWRATIGFQRKTYRLGEFSRFEDAVAARKKAEAEMHDKFVEEYDAAQANHQENEEESLPCTS